MATLKTREGKTYENVMPTHETTGVSFIASTPSGEETRFFIPYSNISSIYTTIESN